MLVGILIVLLISVIFLAAFAVQNTGPVTIQFFNMLIPAVPVYAVVISSAALGAIITALVAAASWVRRGLRERGVRQKTMEKEKELADLNSRVAALQAERDGLAQRVGQLGTERDELRGQISALRGQPEPQEAAPEQVSESVPAEETGVEEITSEPKDGLRGWFHKH